MAAGQNGTQGHYDFDPMPINPAEAPLPDAGDGLYTMTIVDCSVKAAEKEVTHNGETGKKKIPNIRYALQLSEAQDSANEVYNERKLSYFYTAYPADDTGFAAKMERIRHQQFAGSAGLDLSLFPDAPTSLAQFDDWKAAVKGKSFIGGVKNRVLPDGTPKLDFLFNVAAATEAAVEEAPPPPKRAATKGTAQKSRR